MEHFAPFIYKIWIRDEKGLQEFFHAQSKFRRLKEIHIYSLKPADMIWRKKISMGKIEFLRIKYSESGHNLHEFVEKCAKLKRLQIEGYMGPFNWLNRKYPTLEHLTFISYLNESIEVIPMLLELNQNIRRFSTTSTNFWELQDKMMIANVKLDDLAIRYIEKNFKFDALIDLLNKLHDRGTIKDCIFI